MGRIIPIRTQAPEGTWVWCFGSDEPGWRGYFAPGDGASLQQPGTLGAARLVRAVACVRGASTAAPAGWRWEFYCRLGGRDAWAFTVPLRRQVALHHLVVPTVGLDAAATLALEFGLRVVGPSGAAPVELEVPAVYLDQVALDDTAAELLLANHLPEPSGTGAPSAGAIHLDVVDAMGPAPVLAQTRLFLGEVLLFNGATGTTRPGFAVSATGLPGTLRFTIVPLQPFASQQQVTLRVESASEDGLRALDSAYSFETEDYQGPALSTVLSRELQVVRVTFSEDVNPAQALAVEAYRFTRLTAPAVEVEPVVVVQVSAREYDVELDIPLTPDGGYRLVVEGVEDVRGNPIVAPYNGFTFTGFRPPSPQGRSFQLLDMLPRMNLLADDSGDLRAFVGVLQEPLELMLFNIDRWVDVLDVDVAPERFLDLMLQGLGNPFRFELSVEDKRRLIRVLVRMYRQKGTDSGIINTARFFLGLEVEVRAYNEDVWLLGEDELGVGTMMGPAEKWQHYAFEVVSPVTLTEVQRSRLRAIVEYVKPAWMRYIRVVEPSPPPAVIDHVELGLSELGTQWLLH